MAMDEVVSAQAWSFARSLASAQKNNARHMYPMPVLIASHSLISKKDHAWTGTHYA